MNKRSEKGAFISKSEAVMLQAVAVMLMVWHHLFGFPDRIAESCVLILDRFFTLETFLAYFGGICIVVFAFSSGYGMRKKMVTSLVKTGIVKNYQTVLLQLLKFFSRYWIVFFVFIPIGFLLKVYPVNIFHFIKGILGNAFIYNEEWWYVAYYVRFLLLFPLLALLMDFLQKYVPILLHILMVTVIAILLFLPESLPGYKFMTTLVCFAQGMYFVDSKVFETLYRPFSKTPWLRLVAGITLFGAVFVLNMKFLPGYVVVAPFVFSVMLICKTEFLMRWLRPVLLFVGKYSTYIWLTHTFFAYYYFQKLTFAPRYSWLVFPWCMALSIASGMVLEGLLSLITKGTAKLFKRKN